MAPADPLAYYVEKGEIKPRYYNPNDRFTDVHVLDPSSATSCPGEAAAMFGDARVTVHPLGPVNWRSVRQGPLSSARTGRARAVARLISPDVVRAYDPLAAGWAARAAAQAAGVSYVVSVHTNFDVTVRRSLFERRRWRGLLLHLFTRMAVERPVLRDAAAVIAVYRFAADYVRHMGRRDVLVLYNRVDRDRFVPRADGKPRTEARIRALCVGTAIPERGLDLALQAIASTECELVLVGRGPERPRLQSLAGALGVADRVRFIDRVPNSELPAVYHEADIYVSPHRIGGVSIPVLEAAACGLPIVAVRPLRGVDPEIVPEIGIVCEPTPEALASALRALAEDEALRTELGARARSWAAARPDPEEEEAAVYERVLAAAASRR